MRLKLLHRLTFWLSGCLIASFAIGQSQQDRLVDDVMPKPPQQSPATKAAQGAIVEKELEAKPAPRPVFRGRDRQGNPIFALEPEKLPDIRPTDIVDEFTAKPLERGQFRLGTEIEYGFTSNILAGFDLIATAIGIPTILAKYRFFMRGDDEVALGLRGALLDKKMLLWGSANKSFDELSARYIRPAIIWSNRISSRLSLHTSYAQGFGEFTAELSPQGKRKLWESKHPDGDYESRETKTSTEPLEGSGNQEKQSNQTDSFAQRTLQVSSISGIMVDSFQMTGEITRTSGHKVLVATRFERMELNDLKASNMRLTASQQWLWSQFQLRVGLGLQYIVISGRDLDRETIDEAAVLPATELKFYWIL